MNAAPNNFMQAAPGFVKLWFASRISGEPADKRKAKYN